MKLEKIGKLSIGATLLRIKAGPDELSHRVQLFTIQDLNKETVDPHLRVESQDILVSDKRLKDVPLTKVGMVLIGLTAHKAFVITKAYENRVIPINFVYLECREGIQPEYVAWYFNEHPKMKKQLAVELQGSSLQALSVQVLREMKIDLPDDRTQKLIASSYRLKLRRQKLILEKQKLEEKLMNQLMIQYLKEDK